MGPNIKRSNGFRTAIVGVVVAVSALVLAPAAQAQQAQAGLVSANPADWTPRLPVPASHTAVYAFLQVGTTMYAGGEFTTINGVARHNVVAFDATNGTLKAFAPNVNGPVWGLALAPDGQLVVGGAFTSVNGTARRGVAKLDPGTGAVDPTFKSGLDGTVFDVKAACGRLFVSGAFSKRLLALDPVTGASTGYLTLPVTGVVATGVGPTRVYRMAVDPTCAHLVGIGNFTSVGGQRRYRAFLVDLGALTGTLSPWYYQPLERMCMVAREADYLRGVDFSPDGSYFVVDSTGYTSYPADRGLTVCDAAARFETANLSPQRPTWINYTGGDTLHSVAITGAAVYLGGHNRWLDNPTGHDNPGPGAVDRPGLGALDPATGKALSWNPMRTRGIGAKVLYVTSAGLWVGSDTRYGGKLGCSSPGGPDGDSCAGKTLETHPGIGFLPLPVGAGPLR
jgi:hypothetical protein